MKIDTDDLARRIEAARTDLGKVRDRLRSLLGEVEALLESADEGDLSLETAVAALREVDAVVDKLSEYA